MSIKFRYTRRRGAEKWEDFWTPLPYPKERDERKRTFVPSHYPNTRVWDGGELKWVKS